VNEMTRTGIFAGVAIVAIGLAVVASLPTQFGRVGDDVNALLFEDFQDPLRAHSMSIVKYDAETDTRHEFKIARIKSDKGEVWVIPSHENYPADANTQLADAASALIGKQRGTQVTASKASHAELGVLDPSEENKAAETGVGTLVSFADENETPLAELIIGNEVKDRFGRRYVRIRGQDAVYQVEIDSNKFSTKFEDWIERDVLKMDGYRIKEVSFLDSELVRAPETGGLKPNTKGFLELKYDDRATTKKWSLADLAPGETIDETKADDMRRALDDLKIVNVHKKPPALSRFMAGNEAKYTRAEAMQIQMSLQDHGFFILNTGGIFPSDGQMIVQMDDGLEYQLYFGAIARQTADQAEAARKKKEKKEADPDKKDGESKDEKEDADQATGNNRYVFVGVSLNKDLIKKPDIKPLPGEPLLPVEKAADDKTDEKKSDDATGKKPAKAKRVTLADTAKELRRLTEEGLVDKEELESQRKRVERENQQAQEKYESDLKAAEKKVRELNERFADWYYVIDNEVYKKIRLQRKDIVKAAEKNDDGKKEDARDSGEAKTSAKKAG